MSKKAKRSTKPVAKTGRSGAAAQARSTARAGGPGEAEEAVSSPKFPSGRAVRSAKGPELVAAAEVVPDTEATSAFEGDDELMASAAGLELPDDDFPEGDGPSLEAAAPEEGTAEEFEEAAAPVKAVKDDESQSFLAMYFKNMAELDVLRPEQEFESAREIEALEVELWTLLLSYLPGARHVNAVVLRTMGKPFPLLEEHRALVESLGAKPKPAARKKFEEFVDELASKLRDEDIDRLFVDAAMAEVRRGLRGVAGDAAAGFDSHESGFRDFANLAVAKTVAIKAAKNAFVRANLRLVVSIARRFNHGRLPLADLIQEGNIGLMKAVERYDYRRGFRFSTYASWWIRHAISRALADKGRAVRLPVHMIDAYHRIAKSERELQSKLERPATNEELSEATGIEAEKLEKMRGFLNETPVSLDRPISDEDGRKLIDILISDEDLPSPPDQIIVGETHREMLRLLQSLKPIEADILRKRFGLMNDKERTLKEIGDEYHLSRERVRQLQEQALGKMRKAMQKINAA